jgi:hypothetical protein
MEARRQELRTSFLTKTGEPERRRFDTKEMSDESSTQSTLT